MIFGAITKRLPQFKTTPQMKNFKFNILVQTLIGYHSAIEPKTLGRGFFPLFETLCRSHTWCQVHPHIATLLIGVNGI